MKNLIYFILTLILFSACKQDEKNSAEANAFYTCSMDPQVMKKKPGKCPVCKMELTKTVVAPKEEDKSLKLSDTQISLANIKTIKTGTLNMNGGVSFRGVITANEKEVELISSRVAGRVDRLNFKSIGETVKAGDLLYEIYSEELQASIQQYFLVKAKVAQIKTGNVSYTEMLEAAKEKLMIAGLSEKQITSLKENNTSSMIPFYSKENGVVSEVLIKEGDFINEGAPIFKIVDYSTLWVETEIYPTDEKYIPNGTMVKVGVEVYPGKDINGKVTLVSPELQPGSKINIARVEIENKMGLLKPGMRATVSINSKNKTTLTVPEGAILFEPQMNIAFVQAPNGGFQLRMVEVGTKGNGMIEILNGLHEGDMIVVSGVYLLYSEYMLRNGGDTSMDNMPGMKMSHSP